MRALTRFIVVDEVSFFCTFTIAEIVQRYNNALLPGERQIREQSEQNPCMERETQHDLDDTEYADLPNLVPVSDECDECQACEIVD